MLYPDYYYPEQSAEELAGKVEHAGQGFPLSTALAWNMVVDVGKV